MGQQGLKVIWPADFEFRIFQFVSSSLDPIIEPAHAQ